MLTDDESALLHTLDQSGHAHCREAIRLIERLDAVADKLRDQVDAMTHERQFLIAQADAMRAKISALMAPAPILVACGTCHKFICAGECLG